MLHSAVESRLMSADRASHVRAGMRAGLTGGVGWHGIVHVIHGSEERTFALTGRLFDRQAAASTREILSTLKSIALHRRESRPTYLFRNRDQSLAALRSIAAQIADVPK
jgi:hypothetical protein